MMIIFSSFSSDICAIFVIKHCSFMITSKCSQFLITIFVIFQINMQVNMVNSQAVPAARMFLTTTLAVVMFTVFAQASQILLLLVLSHFVAFVLFIMFLVLKILYRRYNQFYCELLVVIPVFLFCPFSRFVFVFVFVFVVTSSFIYK